MACTAGDNLAVHVAVSRAPAGSVLVVSVEEDPAFGYWGEVLTTAAQARGLSGLVIDGGVRDSTALEAHRFPVFASMVALRGASKDKGGEIATPVVVGDVSVRCGDWVVADADGVVVIDAGELVEVLEKARERADRERRMFEELRGGRTTLDLLGLDGSKVRIGGSPLSD